ncbi:MAG: hypothetical protein QOF83_1364 [Solirubrobacteraceae bacterium]|jgi:hypothetical protein|nr:hypothetical protein [Solirubrobacteraceae bacterium]
MDELEALSARLTGGGEAPRRVIEAGRTAGDDRLQRLIRAVRSSRSAGFDPGDANRPEGLAGAVAAELAAATGRLVPEQREALALRELIGLDHSELATVTGSDPAGVASLLAHARIGLRAELRGTSAEPGDCVEHERTLRTATARQDGEPVGAPEEDWLFEHLGRCAECAQAHAAMLEGSTCYRSWPP